MCCIPTNWEFLAGGCPSESFAQEGHCQRQCFARMPCMSEDMYTAAGLKLVCTPKNCEKRAARKGRNRVDDICNTILWHFHVQHDAKKIYVWRCFRSWELGKTCRFLLTCSHYWARLRPFSIIMKNDSPLPPFHRVIPNMSRQASEQLMVYIVQQPWLWSMTKRRLEWYEISLPMSGK